MTSLQTQKLLPGILYTLAAAIGFACSLVLARLSYEHGSDPETVMLIRFVSMLFVLLLWNFLRDQSLRLGDRDRRNSLLCGVLYFVGIFSYLSSVAWLPVSLSVLIFYTFPILVAILTAISARQLPSMLGMFALLLAFVGLLLALEVQGTRVSGVGMAFAVCAPVAVSLNLILSGRVLQRVDTQVFNTYLAVVCAVLSVFVVVFGGGIRLPVGVMGWTVFAGMLAAFYVGFICTFSAVKRLGSMRFASLMNLEPVATIIFALVLLGESLKPQQVLGAAIVIAGVILTQYAANRRPQNAGR